MNKTMNRWAAVIVVLALIITVLPLTVIAAQWSDKEDLYEGYLPDSVQEKMDEAARSAQLSDAPEIIAEAPEETQEETQEEPDELPEDAPEETAEDAQSEPAEEPAPEADEDDEPAADFVIDNGKLDGLRQKDSILSKINAYVRDNSVLRFNTTVYMFEGGSNSEAPYSQSGVRDQAVAIVVKNNEIVYLESCCSTVPDEPDVFAGVWPSAASVKDGVYPFFPWMFKGYSAYLVAAGCDVPCVRLNSEDRTVITEGIERYRAGREIFIHTRNGCVTGGWSTGCLLVADGSANYASFRDAVGTNSSGYVVVDRSLAVQRLGALYDERGYTGAIKALTGYEYSSSSTLHFEDLRYLSAEEGAGPKLSGLVSSNYPLTEVTVSIDNDFYFLDDPAASLRMTANPNQASYSLADGEMDLSGLPQGKYKCTVRAVDASDNEIRSTFSFRVETEG